jgi:hypothetical protein
MIPRRLGLAWETSTGDGPAICVICIGLLVILVQAFSPSSRDGRKRVKDPGIYHVPFVHFQVS